MWPTKTLNNLQQSRWRVIIISAVSIIRRLFDEDELVAWGGRIDASLSWSPWQLAISKWAGDSRLAELLHTCFLTNKEQQRRSSRLWRGHLVCDATHGTRLMFKIQIHFEGWGESGAGWAGSRVEGHFPLCHMLGGFPPDYPETRDSLIFHLIFFALDILWSVAM